jgi:hypothetical protein
MMGQRLRSCRSRLGATLAEGIVAMFVSLMFLSLLPGFYTAGIEAWQRESGKLSASGGADFAIERMKEDMRSARSASVSTDGTVLLLVMPLRAYDSALGREANVIGAQGLLQDGNSVQYFLLQDASCAGCGSTLCRRVIDPDGNVLRSAVLAHGVHPELNLLDTSTGQTQPVFSYVTPSRTLAVNIAVAEPDASTTTFSPGDGGVKCRRDGGALTRVATQAHPEGELQCSICGAEVESNAQVAAYGTRMLLRNN